MASQQTTDHSQIRRVRSFIEQVTGGSSLGSSRRSSFSSSTRGSIYSEGSVDALQDHPGSGESVDQGLHEEEEEEDGIEMVARVCSVCKEEIQVQQALSVQQARQR